MIIKRVKIQSFGTAQNESHDFDPNLNVIFGPNEAGKSTLRSFITTTLFPKSGLKYPTQKKSDSGSIDVELADGSLRTYKKDGKSSDSNAPDLCGIDDKEYISIYSMSPSDLRDMKTIEKGGIRDRFLTIPGGADLPSANKSLDTERFELLPEKRRSSSCQTAVLIMNETRAKARVNALKNREAGDAYYAELVAKRDELNESIERVKVEVEEKDRIRNESLQADAYSDNLKKIEELKKKEKELTYSESVDETKLGILENEVKSCQKASSTVHARAEEIRPKLGGYDYKKILNKKNEITFLDKNSLIYEQEKRATTTQPSPQPQPVRPNPQPSPMVQKSGVPILSVVGIIAIALGIALIALVNVIIGIIVGIAGAALTVFGFVKNKQSIDTCTIPGPDSTSSNEVRSDQTSTVIVQKKSELVESMDNTLNEILSEIGMRYSGFQADVQKLTNLVGVAEKYQDLLKEVESADKDLQNAKSRVDTFLDGFGGREKYNQAVKDKNELSIVRGSLKALEDSTKNAPVPQKDSKTANDEFKDANARLNGLMEQQGTVNQAIKGILDDIEVENAITVWNDAESAIYEAALKWASLTLERIMLDRASEEAYEKHRPDVMKNADRFLNMMTCGRYRMNTDPRITDIAVIDTETGDSKTDSEWSSGLEDQVKLALKLAVSLSLSKERPPVILDDILLTSDSERKKGACKAIASLSEDIQVLFFTCDKETREFMEETGGKIITL